MRLAFMVFAAALLASAPVPAQVDAVRFASAQQESLYAGLLVELRCLVCANQSLADSNADLAKDLRAKVAEMVADGRGREEIIDYMVHRYGEYILYRPRFSAATVALWAGPFVAALAGFAFIGLLAAGKFRRRPQTYSAGQLQKAKSLLEDDRS